jgi:hypothetical protein
MLMNMAAKVLWVGRASSIMFVLPLVVALVLALPSCSNEKQAQNDASATNKSAQSSPKEPEQGAQVHVTAEGAEVQLTIATAEAGEGAQEPTPVVGDVLYAPIPFAGSDGRTHLVYELAATNFSSGKVSIGKLEVLDADTGDVVTTLDAKEVAGRLQPAGLRDAADSLAPSTTARIFLHVVFGETGEVPDRLVHRLSVGGEAIPPDQQPLSDEVGPVEVDRRNVVVIGPPLRGSY